MTPRCVISSHHRHTLDAQSSQSLCYLHAARQTGLCGRTLIEFARRDGVALPASEIGAGDIVQVGLDAGGGQDAVTGIVFRANEARITVSFDEYPDIDEPLTLVKLANEVTFKRYRQMLDKLARDNGCSPLTQVLFGHTQPSIAAKPTPIDVRALLFPPPNCAALYQKLCIWRGRSSDSCFATTRPLAFHSLVFYCT